MVVLDSKSGVWWCMLVTEATQRTEAGGLHIQSLSGLSKPKVSRGNLIKITTVSIIIVGVETIVQW